MRYGIHFSRVVRAFVLQEVTIEVDAKTEFEAQVSARMLLDKLDAEDEANWEIDHDYLTIPPNDECEISVPATVVDVIERQ